MPKKIRSARGKQLSDMPVVLLEQREELEPIDMVMDQGKMDQLLTSMYDRIDTSQVPLEMQDQTFFVERWCAATIETLQQMYTSATTAHELTTATKTRGERPETPFNNPVDAEIAMDNTVTTNIHTWDAIIKQTKTEMDAIQKPTTSAESAQDRIAELLERARGQGLETHRVRLTINLMRLLVDTHRERLDLHRTHDDTALTERIRVVGRAAATFAKFHAEFVAMVEQIGDEYDDVERLVAKKVDAIVQRSKEASAQCYRLWMGRVVKPVRDLLPRSADKDPLFSDDTVTALGDDNDPFYERRTQMVCDALETHLRTASVASTAESEGESKLAREVETEQRRLDELKRLLADRRVEHKNIVRAVREVKEAVRRERIEAVHVAEQQPDHTRAAVVLYQMQTRQQQLLDHLEKLDMRRSHLETEITEFHKNVSRQIGTIDTRGTLELVRITLHELTSVRRHLSRMTAAGTMMTQLLKVQKADEVRAAVWNQIDIVNSVAGLCRANQRVIDGKVEAHVAKTKALDHKIDNLTEARVAQQAVLLGIDAIIYDSIETVVNELDKASALGDREARLDRINASATMAREVDRAILTLPSKIKTSSI